METSDRKSPADSPRLRYREAAAYLGVPLGTLRSMVHRRQVPHIRLTSRSVVFEVADLDRWLAEHRVDAKPAVHS